MKCTGTSRKTPSTATAPLECGLSLLPSSTSAISFIQLHLAMVLEENCQLQKRRRGKGQNERCHCLHSRGINYWYPDFRMRLVTTRFLLDQKKIVIRIKSSGWCTSDARIYMQQKAQIRRTLQTKDQWRRNYKIQR